MNSRGLQIVTLSAIFGIGLITGILVAPASGEKTRRQLGLKARQRLDQAEKKLEAVERLMTQMNDRLGNIAAQVGGRLSEAARETVDQHVPDLSLPNEKWDLSDDEMKRELRHIGR